MYESHHKLFLLIFALATSLPGVFAQKAAIKSNLLYDATTSLNLGLEVGLGERSTLDISGNINPWTFSGNRKMKHWLLQPEYRIWTCSRFSGAFWGFSTHLAQYNFGGMLPWGFHSGKMFGTIENRQILDNRYEGWLAGGGVSYGYHWMLSPRWNLEASIGAGYARIHYDKYPCTNCGTKLDEGKYNYWGVTKAAVSLIYIIK